ncbi:MAG: hypothetical protein JWR32_4956 [Mycobacterium sp.]|jgi:hypothetical protein|nr:hypothetical protein [Mycobacterium sp.]
MTTGETYAELSNKTVSAANGVEYVYRDAGQRGVPLVLLQPRLPRSSAVARPMPLVDAVIRAVRPLNDVDMRYSRASGCEVPS